MIGMALIGFVAAALAGRVLGLWMWERRTRRALPPARAYVAPEELERHYRLHREEQIAELAQWGNGLGYIDVPLPSCCRRGECSRLDDDPRMPVAPGRKL